MASLVLIVLVALSHGANAEDELVYIERRGQALIKYGYETFFISQTDKTEIKYTVNVPERENNINLCLRLGKSVADCQNCIQFVREQNARIIACGTDATIRTCYIINQTGQVIRTFPAHDLVSVKPSDWPHWVELGDDKIAAISADQDSKFGLHLMRLNESESQNEKSFKFDDNHDFYSISSQDDRVILFGSRQIGDVRRGYIYQMCHNDPGTKESGNSFSQIAKVELECEHDGQIYRNLVSTHQINETSSLGLFTHEYNQNSVLCIINSLNKLNFNCSKSNADNEATRVIELRLTEVAIYVDRGLKLVTIMPNLSSVYLHSQTKLTKKTIQNGQLYHNWETQQTLVNADKIVGWNNELVYLTKGKVGVLSPQVQCPYSSCLSCVASRDYCSFNGQPCQSLTCPELTVQYETKRFEHGTAVVLEFDKVRHNITNSKLSIYDRIIWRHGQDQILADTSDFVMSETNERAALIIFNPSELADQTFTLNVMLNQIVIYTIVYTLALSQTGQPSEEPKTTVTTTTTPATIEVAQAGTLGNPVIIILLVTVGLLLSIVVVLCLRVKRQNVDHDHEKTPMIKNDEKVIIVLPGGETKTAKRSDIIHVGEVSSRDDYVQSRLKEAINKIN